jgi:hypothetical protein
MTAFRQSFRGAVNGRIQQILRIIWLVGQYVTHRLKAQHQRVETL